MKFKIPIDPTCQREHGCREFTLGYVAGYKEYWCLKHLGTIATSTLELMEKHNLNKKTAQITLFHMREYAYDETISVVIARNRANLE